MARFSAGGFVRQGRWVLLWVMLVGQAPTVRGGNDSALDRVTRHRAVFSAPPAHVPTRGMPDGPLLGNGDVGIVLAGPPEAQRFHIGKNDFWTRHPGDARVIQVGRIEIDLPDLRGAAYRQETDLARAEVVGQFTRTGLMVRTRSRVLAQENLLLTDIVPEGGPLRVTVRAISGSSHDAAPADGFVRRADDLPGTARVVAVATRWLGGAGTSFTLAPGVTGTIATVILSDLDDPACSNAATVRLAGVTTADINALDRAHRDWWTAFWSRSFIAIPDQEIEKRWYGALYALGCCSRSGEVAPGLWGNWVTTDQPNWHGDFHLNYNFQAPFYLAYSANHADLTRPFYNAIVQSVENGRAMARRRGWAGVHFPVCIGPWGLSPEDPDRDFGQRSNAAYAALNFIWYWQYTQDDAWLRGVGYPYLREVADFWDAYLSLEDGRYVIHRDAIHEGSGEDMNPILSLGLLRTLYDNLITMSETLNADEARRGKWRDILLRLSAFPVQERGGRTVFRYTEKGTAWWDSNTLGIQHIFPAGAIGLDSAPALLEISRATLDVMGRWADYNGFSSFYTAAARVGYDPQLILQRLRTECDQHALPNLLLYYGGGGIESCGGFLAINEMLLQSHDGVLRLFPNWPREQDAAFGTLRARGAFLVSAEQRGGVVQGVRLRSERGGPCILTNPWPERAARLVNTAGREEVLHGPRFSFATAPGEELTLEVCP